MGSKVAKARAPATQPSAEEVLGRAIRARRKALRLTQLELGRFAGCGVAFLYELEAGKRTVRLDKVLDVLSVLGLELRIAPGKRGLVADAGRDG